MNRLARVLAALAVAAAAGCTATGSDEQPKYLIPNETLNISPSLTIPAEALVAGAIVYFVVDPLAPNWRIVEARLATDRYQIALMKKRFTTGGDGEAEQLFHRRAQELARENGGGSYRVVEYTEGVESHVMIARRVARGVVEIVR